MKHALLILTSIFALGACNEHGSSAPVQCFNMECSGAQLCLVQSSGVDAGTGAGAPPQCIAIPKGCLVSDCSGTACPRCILDLCLNSNLDEFVMMTDRTLRCPAQ